MKKLILIMILLFVCGCQNSNNKEKKIRSDEQEQVFIEKDFTNMIYIKINDEVYQLTLYDNEAVRYLLDNLPMVMQMNDLNGNEKYYYLPDKMPINPQPIDEIKQGDLMLFGNDCLVLFYKNFITNYQYTKIGYVENLENLDKDKAMVVIKMNEEE